MGQLNFGSTPIYNIKQFSWVFLADFLLAITAGLFIVYYADRVTGWCISQVAGWILWRTKRIYFSVASVKFSLFGGRIFFKNFVYIGENEAISIMSGTYSWRYWLKRVRRNGVEHPDDDPKYPARQLICLTGVEWFIYNQASAYQFEDSMSSSKSHDSVKTSESQSFNTVVSKQEFSRTEQSLFRLMPISVEMNSFSIISGNPSTSTLFVIHSNKASIDVDVNSPTVACDRYKMILNLTASKPKAYFTVNHDYDPERVKTSKSRIAHWYSVQEIFHNVRQGPKHTRKKKQLHRKGGFSDDTPEDHSKVSKLLDCDELTLNYFWDVCDICYKEDAPEGKMGVTATFTNAVFNYGPWTERRRVEFFELFWPQKCQTYDPTVDVVGSLRVIPRATKNINFKGQVTLRIPTREFSKAKDHRTISQALNDEPSSPPQQLPYGWMEIVAAEGSFVDIEQDYVPRGYGFEMLIDMVLKKVQVRTSVNHAELLSADTYRLGLKQHTPLKWNALQTWSIKQEIDSANIFILREHINLALDITEDLGSGKKTPYELFIPATYKLDIDFKNLSLYTNVNPQNIISNPTSLAENVFLVFKAPQLTVDIDVPMDQVEPVKNTVTATTQTDYFTMDLSMPSWHTLDAFLDSQTAGCAHNFKMTNTITYFSEIDFSRVEEHSIDIYAKDFTLISAGYVIDYLISLLDNYGGLDFKFQTPEEFMERVFKPPQYNVNRGDTDVDYRIKSLVENSCFVFPAYLYSARDNISLFTNCWSADLRFTNYYMDLQTEFSPVKGYINKNMLPEEVITLYKPRGANILQTDELIARAHRMFGMPPSEPTYICKWDIDIGDIEINIPAESLRLLNSASHCFGHGFRDAENKPRFEVYKPPDVIFLNASIGAVTFQALLGDEKINCNTSPIKVKLNDLENYRFSSKIFIDIPSIYLFSSNPNGKTYDATTSCRISFFTVKSDHKVHYEKQQDHLMKQDSLFHRCPFLLDEKRRMDPLYQIIKSEEPHVCPAMPIPPLPPQLTRETLLIIDSEMGQLDYKNMGVDSDDSASGLSIYGSNLDQISSSSEFESDDTSSIVKRKAKADNAAPTDAKYLPPPSWSLPSNEDKNKKGEPVFAVDAAPYEGEFRHYPDNMETVNVVIELSPVVLTANNCFHDTMHRLGKLSEEMDPESVLDEIQFMIVKELEEIDMKHIKLILQVPSVSIKLSGGDQCIDLPMDHYILGEFGTVQLVGDIWTTQDFSGLHIWHKFKASFESFVVAARSGKVELTRVELSSPEIVFSKEPPGANLELRTGALDFTTKAHEIEELMAVIESLKPSVPPPDHGKMRHAKTDLIYTLLTVGKKADIEHDSYVLSRSPAVQVKNNIRSDLSWRVAVRLRYLLNHLTPLEIIQAPKDAKEQSLKILEPWRSWERTSPLNEARIFKEFDKMKDATVIPKILLSIESLSTILKYSDAREDYLVFDEFEVRAGVKKPGEHWAKCHIVAISQRVRLGLSWDIVKVISVIEKIHAGLVKGSKTKQPEQTGELIFQALISLSVRDWTADLQSDSLTGEFQNKDVQLVSTVDYRKGAETLFASGVFGSSQSAIRAHSPHLNLELVDYLMEKVSVGFSTDTVDLKGPLWLSVKVDTLNLAINATIEELCRSAHLIIKNEGAQLRSLYEELKQGGNDTSGEELVEEVDTSIEQSDPVKRSLELLPNVNLKVASFVFRVKALSDFTFVFSGSDFSLSGRAPEKNALLFNIDWRTYVLRVITEETQVLGSFLVEGTRILARADLDAPAFDVKYGVDRVNLETKSVLIVLKYFQSPKIIEKYKNAKAAADLTFAEAMQQSSAQSVTVKRQPTESRPVYVNTKININQVRILLPVDEFSFHFVFDKISAEHKRFTWAPTGIEPKDVAFTYVNISELSSKLVTKDHSFKVLSVQLLGSYRGKAHLSSIYFTSDFCKVVLSPSASFATVAAIDKVKSNIIHLLPQADKEKNGPDTLELLASMKAAIALREFSVTWLTEQAESDSLAEGVIVGFELLQINLVSLQCRMDLIGFNVTPKISPWKSLKKNQLQNYAFLPHVEIIGVLLAQEKFIHLIINGETLRVNLKPSVGVLICAIMSSVDKTRELLEAHEIYPASPSSKKSPEGSTRISTSIEEHKATLMEYSLISETKFDAATFQLWDDNVTIIEGSTEPSLELNSPDMFISMEYIRRDEGRDSASIIMNVSKSENQILPKALQELKALFNYSLSTKSPALNRKPQNNAIDSTDNFPKLQGEVISSLLSSIDVTIRISLDTQRLTIGCQPFSKIETTVSSDSIQLVATTPMEEDGTVSVAISGFVRNAHLVLQHAHSHERSGFGGIDELGLTAVHKISKNLYNEPILIGVNIVSPKFEVKATQIKDIKLFVDIWNPKKELAIVKAKSSTELDTNSLGMKYRKLLSDFPMPWVVNIVATDIFGQADLGSSIGQLKVKVDHSWGALHRFGHMQHLVVNLGDMSIDCVGRVGAEVHINGLSKRTTVYWAEEEMVPLIQLTASLQKIVFSLSIDGHTFIASQGTGVKTALTNQLTKVSAELHRLLVFASVSEISLSVTSLVASNIYDITEPLHFLRTQSAIYQNSLAKDEEVIKKCACQATKYILARLAVDISGQIDNLHLYVFPTNFEDTTILAVRSKFIKVAFGQDPSVKKSTLYSNLEIESRGFKVALQTVKPESTMPNAFFERLRNGNISSMLFNIPELRISMQTTDYDSKKVEYLFTSVFGADLEVGWNLGTVNFIRELYETHERTWASRTAVRQRALLKSSTVDTEDEIIEEEKPEYVAIQPPTIQIPNLHDMGNATPPVEWMGFNRNRLPGLTHWLIIRSMNQVVESVEEKYGQLLH